MIQIYYSNLARPGNVHSLGWPVTWYSNMGIFKFRFKSIVTTKQNKTICDMIHFCYFNTRKCKANFIHIKKEHSLCAFTHKQQWLISSHRTPLVSLPNLHLASWMGFLFTLPVCKWDISEPAESVEVLLTRRQTTSWKCLFTGLASHVTIPTCVDAFGMGRC